MADPASKARPIQVIWLIPPGLAVEEVIGALSSSRPCSGGPPQVVHQTWLDSFDWRLHRRGWTLLHEAGGSGGSGSGGSGGSGSGGSGGSGGGPNVGPCTTSGVVSAPEFATLQLWTSDLAQPMRAHLVRSGLPAGPSDLPPSRLRDAIAAVLGVRCLVPFATAATTRRSLKVLDSDEKTVAWVLVEASAGPAGAPLGKRARVLAVKGYGQAAESVDRFLGGKLGLEPDPGVMAAALASTGRWAGDYSSKLEVAISANQGIDTSVKALLAHLLATVEANRDGASADLDPEFLHDIRVATRRARSLLGEAAPYLAGAGATSALRAELAWLGEVTGPIRDLDVWLATIDEELATATPVAHELEALRRAIEARRRDVHRQLVDQLDSDRFGALRSSWAALASPQQPPSLLRSVAGGGKARTGAVAADLVRRAQRRVLRRGSAVEEGSPDESLHDLRKATKRLRYVLESFASLCPGALLDRLLGELKALQDNLGEFQDCSVQATALARLGSDLIDGPRPEPEEGPAPDTPPEALIAVGYLIAGLERRRTKARAEFAERFARFERPATRHLVDSLASSLGEDDAARKSRATRKPDRAGAP